MEDCRPLYISVCEPFCRTNYVLSVAKRKGVSTLSLCLLFFFFRGDCFFYFLSGDNALINKHIIHRWRCLRSLGQPILNSLFIECNSFWFSNRINGTKYFKAVGKCVFPFIGNNDAVKWPVFFATPCKSNH